MRDIASTHPRTTTSGDEKACNPELLGRCFIKVANHDSLAGTLVIVVSGDDGGGVLGKERQSAATNTGVDHLRSFDDGLRDGIARFTAGKVQSRLPSDKRTKTTGLEAYIVDTSEIVAQEQELARAWLPEVWSSTNDRSSEYSMASSVS